MGVTEALKFSSAGSGATLVLVVNSGWAMSRVGGAGYWMLKLQGG